MFNRDYTMHKCSQCLLLFLFFLGFFFSGAGLFYDQAFTTVAIYFSFRTLASSAVWSCSAIIDGLIAVSRLQVLSLFSIQQPNLRVQCPFGNAVVLCCTFQGFFIENCRTIGCLFGIFKGFHLVFSFQCPQAALFYRFFPLFICFNCTSFFLFLKK